MKFHTLGSSDLSVSDVCLGTMTWGSQNTEGGCPGGPTGAQAGVRLSLTVDMCSGRLSPSHAPTEEAHEQLDAFIALGGNFIDTAEVSFAERHSRAAWFCYLVV